MASLIDTITAQLEENKRLLAEAEAKQQRLAETVAGLRSIIDQQTKFLASQPRAAATQTTIITTEANEKKTTNEAIEAFLARQPGKAAHIEKIGEALVAAGHHMRRASLSSSLSRMAKNYRRVVPLTDKKGWWKLAE